MTASPKPWYLTAARIGAVSLAIGALSLVVYCTHRRHNATTPGEGRPAANSSNTNQSPPPTAKEPGAKSPPPRIFMPSTKAGIPRESLRQRPPAMRKKPTMKIEPAPNRPRVFLPSTKAGVPIESFRPRPRPQPNAPKQQAP